MTDDAKNTLVIIALALILGIGGVLGWKFLTENAAKQPTKEAIINLNDSTVTISSDRDVLVFGDGTDFFDEIGTEVAGGFILDSEINGGVFYFGLGNPDPDVTILLSEYKSLLGDIEWDLISVYHSRGAQMSYWINKETGETLEIMGVHPPAKAFIIDDTGEFHDVY